MRWIIEAEPIIGLDDKVNKLKISYIGTLYKVRFIQDSSLFRVKFRQVSLYVYCRAGY